MTEHKTNFTFSYFDAAHTDGYIAPSNGPKKEMARSVNQVTSQKGGEFFTTEEKDEDIVTKIHHWQNNTKDRKKKSQQNHRELINLFSDPVKMEDTQRGSDDTNPPASEDIQLSRLLDDYMLGEKGDQIMQQMEDLTTDDPRPPVAKSQNDLFGADELKDKQDSAEPSLDLNAMMSMEDFEKYIAEN